MKRHHPAAVTNLIRILGSSDQKTALAARDALVSKGEEAVPALVDALTMDNALARAYAAGALLKFAPEHPAAVETLTQALRHPQQEVRHHAATALMLQAGKQPHLTTADYIALLRDEDDYVRCFAADALAYLGPPETLVAKEALIAALDYDDHAVSYSAITAVGELGTAASEAVPRLLQSVAGGGENFIMAALAEALGNMGPAAAAALPVLHARLVTLEAEIPEVEANKRASPSWAQSDPVEQFENEVANVRLAIEKIEGRLGPIRKVSFADATIPELIAALDDQNLGTVKAACRALVRGGSAGVPALMKMVRHAHCAVQLKALATLQALGPQAQAALAVLIQGFDHPRAGYQSGAEVIDACIKAVVRIGPAALPELRAALASKNERIHKGAAKALELLGK